MRGKDDDQDLRSRPRNRPQSFEVVGLKSWCFAVLLIGRELYVGRYGAGERHPLKDAMSYPRYQALDVRVSRFASGRPALSLDA